MKKEVKPLLIVEVPVGDLSIARSQEYIIKVREKFRSLGKDEYYMIFLESRNEDWKFTPLFASQDVIDTVMNIDDLKELSKTIGRD